MSEKDDDSFDSANAKEDPNFAYQTKEES